jgi:hypothetical protein
MREMLEGGGTHLTIVWNVFRIEGRYCCSVPSFHSIKALQVLSLFGKLLLPDIKWCGDQLFLSWLVESVLDWWTHNWWMNSFWHQYLMTPTYLEVMWQRHRVVLNVTWGYFLRRILFWGSFLHRAIYSNWISQCLTLRKLEFRDGSLFLRFPIRGVC